MEVNHCSKMNQLHDNLTIYTPINSNYENLDIIYGSLINQTNQKFIWYILDYNESDLAFNYVYKFKSESKIQIEYVHKHFKGRYLATKYAFENIYTNYIIGLDGAYFIVKDCVEVILNHWHEIEKEKNHFIAEIRGLANNKSKELVGKSQYHYKKEYVDMRWHEMVLKNGNYYEMLASWDRLKFLECVNWGGYDLFSEQIDELSTTLFWSSLGRKYQTRYLNKILKCKIDSVSLDKKSSNDYNTFVSGYYFLVENIDFFFYSPKYYTGVILSFISASTKLNLSLNYLLTLSQNMKYKLVLISYYYPAKVLLKSK